MALTKDDLNKKQSTGNRNKLVTTGGKCLSTVSRNFGLLDLNSSLNKVAETGNRKAFLEQAKQVVKAIEATKLHLIFLIDKSSSCCGTEFDTKIGFKNLIEYQENQKYSTFVSTILFAGIYKVLYKEKNCKMVPFLDYVADGNSTSLYDALCSNLRYFRDKSENNYDYTIVVIMTDGMDNSSLNTLVNAQKEIKTCLDLGWEFLFLGARIDSKNIASSLGIDSSHAEYYNTANGGIIKNFDAIIKAIESKLLTGKISNNWSESIRKNNVSLGIGSPKKYLLTGGK